MSFSFYSLCPHHAFAFTLYLTVIIRYWLHQHLHLQYQEQVQLLHHSNTTLLIKQEMILFAAAHFNTNTELAKSPRHPKWIMGILIGTYFS